MLPTHLLPQLSPIAAKVYFVLLSTGDTQKRPPTTQISLPKLSTLAGLAPRTCSRALHQLKSLQLIHARPHPHHAPPIYFLIPPQALQPPKPPSTPVQANTSSPCKPLPATIRSSSPLQANANSHSSPPQASVTPCSPPKATINPPFPRQATPTPPTNPLPTSKNPSSPPEATIINALRAMLAPTGHHPHFADLSDDQLLESSTLEQIYLHATPAEQASLLAAALATQSQLDAPAPPAPT